ncbi:MAG: stage III sporulation protein AE, partial [Roseburia sp.]|nr:stage III sporulation protein AE [Roseburia sp.]
MRKKKWITVVLLALIFLCVPAPVSALETDSFQQGDGEDGTFIEEMMGNVDFAELDGFLEREDFGMRDHISFSELVGQMLEQGFSDFDYSRIMDWLKEVLFAEVDRNRKLLIEVVLLAVGFSILKNFAGAFSSSYISDLCFL